MTAWTNEDSREYERLTQKLSQWWSSKLPLCKEEWQEYNDIWAKLERLKNKNHGTMPPKPPSTPKNALNVP